MRDDKEQQLHLQIVSYIQYKCISNPVVVLVAVPSRRLPKSFATHKASTKLVSFSLSIWLSLCPYHCQSK